jgi:hypothetical protein
VAGPESSTLTGTPSVPQGSTPVPDPTELTRQAVERLEKSMTSYIDTQLAVRDERLDGVDEATKLRKAEIDHIPALIATDVGHLEKLMEEKFDAAERLRVEQKKDTKDAVDAALNAAKEAVKEQTASSEKSITKSELATGKQIEQLASTITTAIDGLRKSIDDLKERENEDVRVLRQSITDVATTANGSVANKAGGTEQRQETRQGNAALYALIGLVITVVVFGMGILGAVAAVKP